jgi:hypothetical protein
MAALFGAERSLGRLFAKRTPRPKVDTAICQSVQKGLTSRAYQAGRLSVRREAGEHLFHRLLAADLKAGLA